ncbi:hypothetical protein HYC85_015973 [Camellia sinensis]|uniref:DUF4378 domain-containing protein n=1 Tax=Camellia sinensis TaxID=4442 RepID=A0A7J7GZL8_CAMSI|nr:hypothetical protein HYC85_015973 [Camellia sinensis]
MPQDSLRSAVYRSFVTCDDPKGAIECRTIRKSKTSSKKSDKIERNHQSHKEGGEEMESKNVAEDSPSNPSCFQLMEVSKGAHKINQVIDSWSKRTSFDGNSKEIAKDLLKGALDLQESLMMLGKLQEASQYMAQLKKSQKEKSERERIDEMGVERTNSRRFADHKIQTGFQKPRLSFDDYSRGCRESSQYIDKLKKTQEGKSGEERVDSMGIERMNSHRFADHNYQMGIQKPRLSLDGYSRGYQEGSQYLDNKLKKKQEEKSGGERIDRMGVERMNSHRFADHNYQMGFQKPRLSAAGYSSDCFEELRTAIRDGLARQNLLPPGEKRAYCDKRTLDSALDMASTSSSQSSLSSSKVPQKSKGSNLIAKLMGLEEISSQAVQTIPRKQSESENVSIQRRPIFDIDMPKARKPQSATCKVDLERRKLKEIVETMHYKGLLKSNSAYSNASNSKKRFNEDPPPIVIIKPLHFSSLEREEPHLQKFAGDVGGLDIHEVLRNLKKNEGALGSSEICRRFRGEDASIKRISQEGAENCKEGQAKAGETAVKPIAKLSSNKLKVSESVNQEQKKKAIEKKVDRVQKVSQCRRKPAEMENVKSKEVSRSHDQAKVTSTKERKSEIGSNATKTRISQKKSTSSSPMPEHSTPDVPHSYGDRKKNMKNEKLVKKSLAANLVVENVGSKYGDKTIESIELTCENETDMTRTGSTADRLLPEEGTDASEIQIKDQCDSSWNFPHNVTPLTIQHESSLKSAEEANEYIGTKTVEKDFLLSSPSFLSYAEELFDIKPNQTLNGLTPDSCLNDCEKTDTRLLLDCANELVRHKSIRCTQKVHPLLLAHARNSKLTISLAQLVEEVSDGIKDLRSYSKHVGKKRTIDGLYAVLERDLRCEGVASGAWDLGWRHAFTVDEVEQVVGDIEKLVFDGMVEEMFTDFVL